MAYHAECRAEGRVPVIAEGVERVHPRIADALREREHVRLLDRYAGLNGEAAQLADLARRVRGVRRELEGLRQDERERVRRIDLLAYQVEEIRTAGLTLGEIEALEAERRRLANAGTGSDLAGDSHQHDRILIEGWQDFSSLRHDVLRAPFQDESLRKTQGPRDMA